MSISIHVCCAARNHAKRCGSLPGDDPSPPPARWGSSAGSVGGAGQQPCVRRVRVCACVNLCLHTRASANGTLDCVPHHNHKQTCVGWHTGFLPRLRAAELVITLLRRQPIKPHTICGQLRRHITQSCTYTAVKYPSSETTAKMRKLEGHVRIWHSVDDSPCPQALAVRLGSLHWITQQSTS
jgi:hypothetical protein